MPDSDYVSIASIAAGAQTLRKLYPAYCREREELLELIRPEHLLDVFIVPGGQFTADGVEYTWRDVQVASDHSGKTYNQEVKSRRQQVATLTRAIDQCRARLGELEQKIVMQMPELASTALGLVDLPPQHLDYTLRIIEVAARQKLGTMPPRPPLSDLQEAVLDEIPCHPPAKTGKTGKEIVAAVREKGFDLGVSTLTSHIIPVLKKWGVQSKRGAGCIRLPQ
jgi:hypothetical protein